MEICFNLHTTIEAAKSFWFGKCKLWTQWHCYLIFYSGLLSYKYGWNFCYRTSWVQQIHEIMFPMASFPLDISLFWFTQNIMSKDSGDWAYRVDPWKSYYHINFNNASTVLAWYDRYLPIPVISPRVNGKKMIWSISERWIIEMVVAFKSCLEPFVDFLHILLPYFRVCRRDSFNVYVN